MITSQAHTHAAARTRAAASAWALIRLLCPAVAVVLLLFGGGLLLGVLQSLGHLPAAGLQHLTLQHFDNVLHDPDFVTSLMITLYIAGTSTVLAAVISILVALFFISVQKPSRFIHFIFQIPLTVPHLVIAIAVLFMLAPTGIFSRLLSALGIISHSSQFPLLINDAFGIGIILAYVWKEIPFITMMILSVLTSSGKSFFEVGRTLKAGRWQRFRFIFLPLIFPSLGAACLIVFAYTFGAFEMPYLLGQTYPLTLPVWAYKNYSDIDLMARPEGIAIGILIVLIVMAAIVLSQTLVQTTRRRGVIL
jgi:putative spermidine/putrescine transport system permease protein